MEGVFTMSEKTKKTFIIGFFIDEKLPVELGSTNLKEENLTDFKLGDVQLVVSEISNERVYAFCLGNHEQYSVEQFKSALEIAIDLFPENAYWLLDTMISKQKEVFLSEIIKNIHLICEATQYTFDKYKTNKETRKKMMTHLYSRDAQLDEYIEEAEKLTAVLTEVKNLVNEPPNKLTPKIFGAYLVEFAQNHQLHIKRYQERYQLEKIQAHALLAVNQGSKESAELVILEYEGNPETKDVIALVGKGVTFDTGGYSLKAVGSMPTMKTDMAGAATVFGVFRLAVEKKLPVNLVMAVALTDNMLNEKAYLPDDVIHTMNGKTVEIVSTDAEGRLILADALTYMQKHYQVKYLIDVATLTGAAIQALGDEITAIFSNDSQFAQSFITAAESVYEPVWQLPLHDIYSRGIRSSLVADLTNKPQAAGGFSSYAAAFLQEFIDEMTPWLHIDIAGTAYYKSKKQRRHAGASAVMVQSIFKYIQLLANEYNIEVNDNN